ncbi:hypothetical protein Aperf_G00000034509 [Anoplocephala perfoliata]
MCISSAHILIIILFLGVANCFLCNHIGPDATTVVRNVVGLRSLRMKREADSVHISFGVFSDPSFTRLPNSHQIKSLCIDPALKFVEEALALRHPPAKPIKLDRSCRKSVNATPGNDPALCSDGYKDVTYCGPVPIPAEHLSGLRILSSTNSTAEENTSTAGHNFLLYLSARRTKKCNDGTILGYSAHCQQEAFTDRPLAGFINFCLSPANTPQDLSQLVYLTRHELMHILGFSPALYAFFRDKNGAPLTPRDSLTGAPNLGWVNSTKRIYKWSDKIIKTIEGNWTSALGTFKKTVHLVVTPTVMKFATKYFGCPDLEGVELEDQGGFGVSLSHWEMRTLGNELMTATYTNGFRLSNLTLAFLEDTGWYLPNYSFGQDLAWGANRGCVFSTQSCYSFMTQQLARGADTAPFCMTPHESSLKDLFFCTPDRQSFGYCNLVHLTWNSSITDNRFMYTYFGNSSRLKPGGKVIPQSYFGKVDLADYCPFVQEVTWSSSDGIPTRSSSCDDSRISQALTNVNNYKLEVYGPSSICLPIADNWTLLGKNSATYETPIRGAGCYKYQCSRQEGLVLELAGGLQVFCGGGGVQRRLINISACLREPALTILGSFYCPECTSLCTVSASLTNHFT